MDVASIDNSNKRMEALDLARGIAITLMILSHGVKGLIDFEQFLPWGLVPIHLVTKFSSTLFFIVFGASLAVAFLPHIHTPRWPDKRKKLFLRGLKVLFWYKALTIVEMFQLHSPQEILQALQYASFPSYVEILGFYSLALLWVPFVLGPWKSLSFAIRLLVPIGIGMVAYYLYHHFDFWGNAPLKSLFVEHEDYYTWGQLTRAPLVFVGLLIGEFLSRSNEPVKLRVQATGILVSLALVLFIFFCSTADQNLSAVFDSIARNEGKHPPDAQFSLFSASGAVFILAFAFLGGKRLSRFLKPFTIIGRDALNAFIFHIFVLFVFFRYLFDFWLNVSYPQALMLTVLLIFLTVVWIKAKNWVLRGS